MAVQATRRFVEVTGVHQAVPAAARSRWFVDKQDARATVGKRRADVLAAAILVVAVAVLESAGTAGVAASEAVDAVELVVGGADLET